MRDIVVDLWKTTRFNMGYVGEDEATRLIFQLTTDLMTSKTFTIEFNVNGEITVINDISPTDNSIIYVVPEIFTTAEGDIGIQVVGYNDGKVIRSPIVYGRISKSQLGDSGIPLKAYHTHDNKEILDKLSVAGDKLQYAGSDVGLKGDKGDTGATGPQGEPGADGYTPVKGTDYWTSSDKAEIVNDVLAALPTWTGGSY